MRLKCENCGHKQFRRTTKEIVEIEKSKEGYADEIIECLEVRFECLNCGVEWFE